MSPFRRDRWLTGALCAAALLTAALLVAIVITTLATGLSPWGTFRSVYWPSCCAGIGRGMVLQFGRALGETMALV